MNHVAIWLLPFWIQFLRSPLLVSSSPADMACRSSWDIWGKKTGREDAKSFITCSDGDWPTDSNPQIFPNTTQLTLENLVFYQDQFRPIPSLPDLTRLVLKNITVFSSGGTRETILFPLQTFAAGMILDKSRLRTLVLTDLQLPTLEEHLFQGFSGLTELTIVGCNVTYIHPRTFYPFATESFVVHNDSGRLAIGGGRRFSTGFQILSIVGASGLRFFPLESMFPFSETLMVGIARYPARLWYSCLLNIPRFGGAYSVTKQTNR